MKVISYLEMNRLILVNRSKFEAVLESIVRYATDTSDATVEKIAFSILNKMVRVWSGPIAASIVFSRPVLAAPLLYRSPSRSSSLRI